MARFIREFILIPVPFGIVSAFFFLGDVRNMGILFALITLATLWYIRPRRTGPPRAPELVSLDDDLPGQATGAPPGSVGSGIGPESGGPGS